jgi:hypothetical protein
VDLVGEPDAARRAERGGEPPPVLGDVFGGVARRPPEVQLAVGAAADAPGALRHAVDEPGHAAGGAVRDGAGAPRPGARGGRPREPGERQEVDRHVGARGVSAGSARGQRAVGRLLAVGLRLLQVGE